MDMTHDILYVEMTISDFEYWGEITATCCVSSRAKLAPEQWLTRKSLTNLWEKKKPWRKNGCKKLYFNIVVIYSLW